MRHKQVPPEFAAARSLRHRTRASVARHKQLFEVAAGEVYTIICKANEVFASGRGAAAERF
jgi:hypothetical protein